MFFAMKKTPQRHLMTSRQLSHPQEYHLLIAFTRLIKSFLNSISFSNTYQSDSRFMQLPVLTENLRLHGYSIIFSPNDSQIRLCTLAAILVLLLLIYFSKYLKNEKKKGISYWRYRVLWHLVFKSFMQQILSSPIFTLTILIGTMILMNIITQNSIS